MTDLAEKSVNGADPTIADALSVEAGEAERSHGREAPAPGRIESAIEQLPWKSTWVESSHLRRVAFCTVERVPYVSGDDLLQRSGELGLTLGWLWAEFRDESVYGYMDVPQVLYRALIAAESPGRAFRRLVAGRYRWVAWAKGHEKRSAP